MGRWGLFLGMVLVWTVGWAQDSLNVRRLSAIYAPGTPTNCVALSDHYVYMGTGGDSYAEALWVVDVADPAQPQQAAFVEISEVWTTEGVTFSGNRAYVTSAGSGFRIYDVQNPAVPQLLSTYSGSYHRSVISGDYAFVLERPAHYLTVFHVSDSVHPAPVDTLNLPEWALNIAISGSYAFIADAGSGLRVANISNPLAIAEVASLPFLGVSGVAVYGPYIYAVNSFGRLDVVDVTNPAAPQVVDSLTVGDPGEATIVISGSHAYVTAGGLHVLSLANPVAPVETGFYTSATGTYWDVAVVEPYAYVNDDGGLEILDCSDALGTRGDFIFHPSSFGLSCYPNPFNPSTTISFSLPRASEVELKVFDVTGRLVQILTDKRLGAGEHRVAFEGSALPSGIYFARMEAGAFSQTQKMMLLK